MPAHPSVNRHQKRDRLPSAAALANARSRIVNWWEEAYLNDAALETRFLREAAAALPLSGSQDRSAIYEELSWRRLRLQQDQQVQQWEPTVAATE